ncbi:MAG: YdcF family protein [Cyanobacteria bacterium P01_A01_bin.123]
MSSHHSPKHRWFRRWRALFLLGGLGGFAVWVIAICISLYIAARSPVDGFLVLGGSIRREIYVAEQVAQFPGAKVLISTGSAAPCIRILFEQATAPLDQAWLENCADSTFGNFYYGLPLLKRWGVKKVRLVTSPTHLPRAQWMAQIILGAHGIWVEPDIVEEIGIPGNQESRFKTALDVTRALVWAVMSQGYRPNCDRVTRLSSVDLEAWRRRGFQCEHQAGIEED